jgi:hypothetical protein
MGRRGTSMSGGVRQNVAALHPATRSQRFRETHRAERRLLLQKYMILVLTRPLDRVFVLVERNDGETGLESAYTYAALCQAIASY